MKKFIISTLIFLTIHSQALANNFQRSILDDAMNQERSASEYVMRRYRGEKLMPVRILGGVRQPGTYYLPEGTDLLTLLSLSGGLEGSADSEDIQLNNWATKKLSNVNLEDALKDPTRYNPTLGSNDVVMIQTKEPAISNNTLLVVGLISSLIGIAVGGTLLIKGTK